MTLDEVLKKIIEARMAIQEFRVENMERTSVASGKKVDAILRETEQVIVRFIGAAGKACPQCGGSGRV